MHLLPSVRFEPTLDPNTVYRHVLLSDGGHKATMQAENLKPTDHPERFLFWRQVLCREPLAGSPYYWEVEWTGQKVTSVRHQWGNGSFQLGICFIQWKPFLMARILCENVLTNQLEALT